MVNFDQLKQRRIKARKEAYVDVPATPGVGGADAQDNSLAAAPGHQHAPTDTQARQVMDGAAGTRTYTTMRGGFPMTRRSMTKSDFDVNTFDPTRIRKISDLDLKAEAEKWSDVYRHLVNLRQTVKNAARDIQSDNADLSKISMYLDTSLGYLYDGTPSDSQIQGIIGNLDGLDELNDVIGDLDDYLSSKPDPEYLDGIKKDLPDISAKITDSIGKLEDGVLKDIGDRIQTFFDAKVDDKLKADWNTAYTGFSKVVDKLAPAIEDIDDPDFDFRKLCDTMNGSFSAIRNKVWSMSKPVQDYIINHEGFNKIDTGLIAASIVASDTDNQQKYASETRRRLSGVIDSLNDMLSGIQDKIDESNKSYRGVNMAQRSMTKDDRLMTTGNVRDRRENKGTDPEILDILQDFDGWTIHDQDAIDTSDMSYGDRNNLLVKLGASGYHTTQWSPGNSRITRVFKSIASAARRSMTKYNPNIYNAYEQLPDGDLKTQAEAWQKAYDAFPALIAAYKQGIKLLTNTSANRDDSRGRSVGNPTYNSQGTYDALDKAWSEFVASGSGDKDFRYTITEVVPSLEKLGSVIDNLGMSAANPPGRGEEDSYLSEAFDAMSGLEYALEREYQQNFTKEMDELQSEIHSELIKMEGQGKSYSGKFTPAPASDYNTIIDVDHFDTEMSMGAQDGSADDGLAPDSAAHFGRSFASIAQNAAQRLRDRNKAESDAARNFEPVPASDSEQVSLKELKDWVKDQIEHFGENLPVSEVADTNFENIMRGLQTQGDNNVLWTAYDSGMALIRFQDLLKEFKAKDFKAKSIKSEQPDDVYYKNIVINGNNIELHVTADDKKWYFAVNFNDGDTPFFKQQMNKTKDTRADAQYLWGFFDQFQDALTRLGVELPHQADFTDLSGKMINSLDTEDAMMSVRRMSTEQYRAARANLKPRQAISSGSGRTNASKYEGQTPNAALVGGETFGPPNDLNPVIEPDYTEEEMDGNLNAPTYEDVNSDDSLKTALKKRVYKHLAEIL